MIRTRSARVVVRPSGTEPKLKAYLEVVRPVQVGLDGVVGIPAAREQAASALATLRAEVATALGL